MRTALIAAISDNGVIGNNRSLPWAKISADMKWFRERTGGHSVIMGRKTWESLPKEFRPLHGRQNIVVSTQSLKLPGDVLVVSSLENALEVARDRPFIIGGESIYRQALPLVDEMYLTRVHQDVEGDVRFPDWNQDEWNLVWRKDDALGRITWEVYYRKTPLYEFSATRDPKQYQIMEGLLAKGQCHFCPEAFAEHHKAPILWKGIHWFVTENDFPYKGARCHFMMVLQNHVETLSGVPPGAWEEMGTILRWLEQHYGIEGGALGFRFGEPVRSGASIRHVHAHVIVPEVGAPPVPFFIGCYKASQITLP